MKDNRERASRLRDVCLLAFKFKIRTFSKFQTTRGGGNFNNNFLLQLDVMTFLPRRRLDAASIISFDDAPFSSFIHPFINIISRMNHFIYSGERAHDKSSFCNSSVEIEKAVAAYKEEGGEIVLLYYEVCIITPLTRSRSTIGEENIKVQTRASGDDNGVCV